MGFRLKLSDKKREAEARKCLDQKTRFESESGFQAYVENLRKWDVQWRGVMPRLKRPWPHATDYNPLLTFSKVEDLHAVLFGFFSNFDFFSVAASAKKGQADEIMRARAQDWTDLMRWSLQNESNSSAFMDRFAHNGVNYGTAVGFMPWLRLVRKIRSELFVPDELRQDREASDTTIIKAALGETRKKGPKPIEGGEGGYAITFVDDDGEEKEAVVWVDRENPFRPEGEPVVVVERESLVYNAPRPRNIDPWDILVPPDARDLQSAKQFWVREYLSYDEIARFVQSGYFNALTDKELRSMREDSGRTYPSVSSSVSVHDSVDAGRDAETGVTKLTARQDQYEVIFQYAYEDVDEDGYAESIIRAVVQGRKPYLLMRQRLEYFYPHGRRPFFDWHLFPVDGRYYGMGVPEVLERSQIENNAFYQSRGDILEIITKPGGMYDPMSGLAPDEIRFTPGMMTKVRDPMTAFRPWAFPVDPTHLIREQSGIELQAERAIGSTDMGLGRGPTRPNSPRTLGGTAIVVRQQQLRTDVFLKRMMYGSSEMTGGVAEFLHQYMLLYSAFMPEEKEFRTLGTDELRVVQRSDLQGRFDFVVDFGPEINNPQIKMQNAMLRYQSSLSNPLVASNPSALWQVTVDMWEATGKRNAARVLPKPQGMESHPPMPQEEENAVLSKGIYIDALPSDNHMQHLESIMALIQDPMRLAQNFGPNELPLLEKHAARHMELATAGATVAAGGMYGPSPTLSSPFSPSPASNGGNGSRGPRVQSSMMGAGNRPMETMGGPVEMDLERGLTP